MNNMPLFRRFIGSVIDKLIILILFIAIFIVMDYHVMGKLFYYLFIIMKSSPSTYHYIGEVDVSYVHFGFYNDSGRDFIQEFYTPDMYEGIVRTFDLKLTFGFILLNVVYYLVCELKFKASLGKYLLGGILIDNFDNKITINDIIVRTLSATVLMASFVGFRFLFNTNYYLIILLFFIAIDFTVFIQGKSLIDKYANVRYVKRDDFVNHNKH